MRKQNLLFLVLAAVLPASIGASAQVQAFQTGWWWNPAQPGTGYFIEQQANSLFFGAYLYAASGEPTWSVSTGALNGNTYKGTLSFYSGGQTLAGAVQPETFGGYLGDVTLQFSDPMHATLTWPGGTIPIQRLSFAGAQTPALPQPGSPQSGWWWNPQRSGTGYAMEFQGTGAFIVDYVYDTAGNATWYIATGTMTSPARFDGTWQQFGGGQTLTGTWQPNTLLNANAGSFSLEFSP